MRAVADVAFAAGARIHVNTRVKRIVERGGGAARAAVQVVTDRGVIECDRVVVVSHGGALGIAFGVLLDDDYSRFDRMMKNCAISELSFAPRPELVTFNQIDHLPPEAPPSPSRSETDGPSGAANSSGAPTK